MPALASVSSAAARTHRLPHASSGYRCALLDGGASGFGVWSTKGPASRTRVQTPGPVRRILAREYDSRCGHRTGNVRDGWLSCDRDGWLSCDRDGWLSCSVRTPSGVARQTSTGKRAQRNGVTPGQTKYWVNLAAEAQPDCVLVLALLQLACDDDDGPASPDASSPLPVGCACASDASWA